jgi:uncharacterized PurR-regulated membrane protein YhhQ (DUF165 family)
VNRLIAIAATAIYIAAIVTANIMTEHLGLVPVGFGLLVTAGTFAAGFALLARDFVHEAGGLRLVLAAIAIGAALSWFMATPALAIASTVAFTAAELVDLLVFTPLRRHGFARAALASNAVSAPVDTVVFLALAGFPLTWPAVLGQLVGKLLWATLVPLALYVGGRRAVRREPQHAVGA